MASSGGFNAGAAAIHFSIRLNGMGEWVETGEVTVGTSPPAKTFEMVVRHQG